jgi:hypothetical protein
MSESVNKSAGSPDIRTPLGRKKTGGPPGYWRNRRYGSISLRRKSKLRRSASVNDKSVWSISMEEANRHPNVRNSEVGTKVSGLLLTQRTPQTKGNT